MNKLKRKTFDSNAISEKMPNLIKGVFVATSIVLLYTAIATDNSPNTEKKKRHNQ